MMTTKDFLEVAMKLIRINKAELSRKIGVSETTTTRYMKGERIIDDYSATKLAELLKINPMRVIAQANIERLVKAGKTETEKEKHYYWLKLCQKLNEEAKQNKEPT